MRMQARQQTDQLIQFMQMQLADIMGKLLADTPVPEGKCMLDNTRLLLQCDNPSLNEKVSGINALILNIYNTMMAQGVRFDGFYFNNQTTPLTLHLLINNTAHPAR